MTILPRGRRGSIGAAVVVIAALGFGIAISGPTPAAARVFVGFGFGFPIGFPGYYYPPYPYLYYPPPPPPYYYPPPPGSPPPASYQPSTTIRPGLAMGLRNRRRHRQSPTRRGRDGPTHKVNSAASTNGPRAPVGTPPEDTGPPVETPTASGASSTDSPHHEHSGADGAGVRVPPRLLKINANFPWSGLGCVVNCIVNAKAAMAWQPIGIDRSSPAG